MILHLTLHKEHYLVLFYILLHYRVGYLFLIHYATRYSSILCYHVMQVASSGKQQIALYFARLKMARLAPQVCSPLALSHGMVLI